MKIGLSGLAACLYMHPIGQRRGFTSADYANWQKQLPGFVRLKSLGCAWKAGLVTLTIAYLPSHVNVHAHKKF
jgi:hypothetical protein